ncbi:Uncharacterised protein [Escherichia coli]|uniref:Uncharacterized protein n=1 Tax=Escherichia coli TaxID=562 RepID=A0A2X3JZY3_ECOLX|nr:Uncharacterised protein [Escherichia coli]
MERRFRTHHDFVFRFLELNHRHNAFVATSSEQCRFVHQVRQVSTGETRSTTGNGLPRRYRGPMVRDACELSGSAHDREHLASRPQPDGRNGQDAGRAGSRTSGRLVAADNDDTFVTFEAIHPQPASGSESVHVHRDHRPDQRHAGGLRRRFHR